MPDSPNKLSQFWHELKRRNVLRTLAVYAGTAFIILEAADIIFPRWGLPDWTFNLVLYLLILGAFITTIVSWIFDVTPKGVERTRPLSEIHESEKPVVSAGWKAATFVSIVVIIGLVIFNFTGGLRQVKTGSIKSLMILPFENYTGDETLEYLVSGMTSELIGEMGQISGLRVISETSSKYFRDTGMPLHQIAEELGLDAVVEPTMMCYGDSLCLQVKLIDVQGEEKQLWIEDYREEKSQILNLYSSVMKRIADEVKVELTDEEEYMLAKSRTVNPDAHEAYMKGQFYLNKFTIETLDSAMKYFELAKEIDPEYALAYTGICNVWAYRQQLGWVTPAEGNPKAIAAAMKAIELDNMSAEAHYSLAHKKTWGMYDWAGGESGFKKSISLNPNNAMTHAVYSHLLNIVGRPEEAMEQIEIALKLDPMNPFIITFHAVNLTFLRKYDEAIRAFQDAMEIEPGYPFAWANLYPTYYVAGDTAEAWKALKSYLETYEPEMLETCEQGYAENGYKGALMSYASMAEIRFETQYSIPTEIAPPYAIIGEHDKALYWLERAYELRDPNIPYLLMYWYDSLRSDPRFQDLCRRMNLPYK